jgi:hypothetical protein
MDLTSTTAPLPCGGSIRVTRPASTQTGVVLNGCVASPAVQVRCVVSNACAEVASVPATIWECAIDYDCSGAANVGDIFAFLNAWFANDMTADFNGGGLALSDIFDFLNAWFVGC